MKDKFIRAYMDTARRFAELSTARNAKVGAIVVKDGRIISIGYNGTPPGWDNNCEHEDWPTWALELPEEKRDPVYVRLKTKEEVLHAERNALDKLALSTETSLGAVMFCTHSPCMECAKSIYTMGIKTLYYDIEYRCGKGIEFLEKCGVDVIKVI